MTIRLNELSVVLLFAVVGVVLWMLRRHPGVTVVAVQGNDYETEDEEIDFPWLGG